MNQQFLYNLIQSDSSFMLENVESWCSHRPLLQIALELTKGSDKPILELGCGYGSTEQLHKYVQTDKRKLYSLETNKEWLKKYDHLNTHNHELVFKPDNLKWNEQKMEWYDSTQDIPNWLDSISKDGISVCLLSPQA